MLNAMNEENVPKHDGPPPHLTDGNTEAWRVKDLREVAVWNIRQQMMSVSITGAFSNEFIRIEWNGHK